MSEHCVVDRYDVLYVQRARMGYGDPEKGLLCTIYDAPYVSESYTAVCRLESFGRYEGN